MKIKWSDTIFNDEKIGYQLVKDVHNSFVGVIPELETLSYSEQLPPVWGSIYAKYLAMDSTIIGDWGAPQICYDRIRNILLTKVRKGFEVYKGIDKSLRYKLPNGNEYKIVRSGDSINKTMGGDVSFNESNSFENFVIDSPTVKAIAKNNANSSDTHTHEGIDESIETLRFYNNYRPLIDFIDSSIQSILQDYTTVY